MHDPLLRWEAGRPSSHRCWEAGRPLLTVVGRHAGYTPPRGHAGYTPPRGHAGYASPVYMLGMHHPCTCWVYDTREDMLGIRHPGGHAGYVPPCIPPGYVPPCIPPGYVPPILPWVYPHIHHPVYTRHIHHPVYPSPSEEALGSNLEINVRKEPLCAFNLPKV